MRGCAELRERLRVAQRVEALQMRGERAVRRAASLRREPRLERFAKWQSTNSLTRLRHGCSCRNRPRGFEFAAAHCL